MIFSKSGPPVKEVLLTAEEAVRKAESLLKACESLIEHITIERQRTLSQIRLFTPSNLELYNLKNTIMELQSAFRVAVPSEMSDSFFKDSIQSQFLEVKNELDAIRKSMVVREDEDQQ